MFEVLCSEDSLKLFCDDIFSVSAQGYPLLVNRLKKWHQQFF